MKIEFQRLENLGWRLPPLNSKELFMPSQIDESKISFPAKNYDSNETNEEASGFWAYERAQLIAEMLHIHGIATLWEVGAGNGNAAIPLRNLGFNVLPVEPLQSGAITLQKNGFATFCSTLEELNLPADSIDAIGAFDVLEHLETPQLLLSEIFRVLKPGGVFVCSVPAYQWLFSDFDVSIGHYRRYSKKLIEESLRRSGFTSISTRYLFGFLVPVAFILRRVIPHIPKKRKKERNNNPSGSSSTHLNKLSFLVRSIVAVEKKLQLQLGLSLFSIGVKPGK